MSSFSTATSRALEKVPSSEASAPDNGASKTLDEVTRVERLLSQLEARSMALVPYGYGTLREVPTRKSKTGLLAAGLVTVWLTTMILGVAYIRYVSHTTVLPERAVTAPLIIPSEPDPQSQKVASSVDHLTRVLATSSERMNELQAAMERSNRDLQKIATKVNSDHAKPAPSVAAAVKPEVVVKGAEAALPKNWHRVLDIKPAETAVPHKGADGSVDYWLVPRGADQSSTKVLPIGTSPEGVVVHNLDDGKDYTLTPSGEWRNGALAASN